MKETIITTSDLALASGLATLGVPFANPPFMKTKNERGNSYIFCLESESTCGGYKTDSLIDAWYSADFYKTHPEHPLGYIKHAFEAKSGLLDIVKQSGELVTREVNGKIMVYSKSASAETKSNLVELL